MKEYRIYADRIKGMGNLLGFLVIFVLVLVTLFLVKLPWYGVAFLVAVGALDFAVMVHQLKTTWSKMPRYIANDLGITDLTEKPSVFYPWSDIGQFGMTQEDSSMVIKAVDNEGDVVLRIDGRQFRVKMMHRHYNELKKRALQANPDMYISDYVNKLEAYLEKKQAQEKKEAEAKKRRKEQKREAKRREKEEQRLERDREQ